MSEKTPHNSARAVPVRVKKKTLKKLTNAERLEVENAKMEERLRSLRQTIEKEKEQRSHTDQRGFLWSSGKPGAITTHAKEHSSKNKSSGIKLGEKKIKVKFLTPVSEKNENKVKKTPRVSTPHNSATTGTSWAEPQSAPPEETQHIVQEQQHIVQEQHSVLEQHIVQQDAWGEEMGRQASIVGPVCGQCETNGAQMNCLECGEKYCSGCFAMFHKRGALKSHTSRPLTRQNINTAPKRVNIDSPISENSLWGEYDEAASAQGFADAVKAWRGEDTSKIIGRHDNVNTKAASNDSSQTTNSSVPDINFSENENLTYFERMMLKKQKDKPASEDDVNSEYSAGEITVSQLDFCRDLLAHNLEEDRISRMDLEERPESVLKIEEVNSNIGYLDETADCVVDEDVIEDEDEDDYETQLQIARELLSNVKIEEYAPRDPDNEALTTVGVFELEDAKQMTSSDIMTSSRPTLTSSEPVMRSSEPTSTLRTTYNLSDSQHIVRSSQQSNSMMSSQQAMTSSQPQRPSTPPRSRKPQTPQGPSEELKRRVQTNENPRSPLIRRAPTNPEISRSDPHSLTTKRPVTADVVILSSQAWKSSFLGFLQAGLPGHTLPPSPSSVTAEGGDTVMLRGPPSWCPGESRTDNEIFQSRENTVTFSLSGQPAEIENQTNAIGDVKPEKLSGSHHDIVCDDLDTSDTLEYDTNGVLEGLQSELSVSKSRDLGDYITSIRNATPDPVTLLTHEDRMSQLDLESRGMTPTATPLINQRITTRESLFLDFEDVERQIMAGEDVDEQ